MTIGELVRRLAGGRGPRADAAQGAHQERLIMQQESSSARSSSLARDWYHLGRARTLDEVGRSDRRLDVCRASTRYLAEHPPRDFTVVTLGPGALEVRGGVS